MTDADLLRQFTAERSEAAFAQLVRRRIDLVYAAALRQLAGDHHRAQDVAQEVFLALARKATSLDGHADLIGWLYTSTHYAALKTIRAEERRRRRENAHAMHDSANPPDPATDWSRIRPAIDSAMHDLSERDRQVVLLRYFEQQSFGAIAGRLGLTENAAQKSAERALDRLHAALAHRGITSTAAALGVGLSTQLASAAPAGLVSLITQTSLAGAVSVGVPALFAMTTTKIGLGLAAGIAVVAVGFIVHERQEKARIASTLARQEANVAALRAESASLRTQVVAAEQRARDADQETGALLKAVADVRTAQAASPPTSTKKNTKNPADMTRTEALAAIESMIREQETKIRADPKYRPYQPPDLSLLPEKEREGFARSRTAAEAKNLLFFPVMHPQGFVYPVTMNRLRDDTLPKLFPALTPADWIQFEERYALMNLGQMMLNPPKFTPPAKK